MRELEESFKALSDPTRLRIVNLLLQGEFCVCDIQRVLHSPQACVSRHLATLRHAGLAMDRRDGLRVFYRLAEPKNGSLASLWEFLRQTFGQEETLRDDLDNLRRAIQHGYCSLPAGSPTLELSEPAVVPAASGPAAGVSL